MKILLSYSSKHSLILIGCHQSRLRSTCFRRRHNVNNFALQWWVTGDKNCHPIRGICNCRILNRTVPDLKWPLQHNDCSSRLAWKSIKITFEFIHGRKAQKTLKWKTWRHNDVKVTSFKFHVWIQNLILMFIFKVIHDFDVLFNKFALTNNLRLPPQDSAYANAHKIYLQLIYSDFENNTL